MKRKTYRKENPKGQENRKESDPEKTVKLKIEVTLKVK